MAGIFISYRHETTAYEAGRLFDDLDRVFGGDRQVFRDVARIQGGSDWEASIDEHLDRCDVVLAVVGPGWLEDLQRGLGRPTRDWVHYELASALKRGPRVKVIPVILDGARLPRVDELPSDLRTLPSRQWRRLSSQSYPYDFDLLVKEIGGASGTVDVRYGPMARKAPLQFQIVLSNARFTLVVDGVPRGELDLAQGTRLKVPAGEHHKLEVRGGFEHRPFLPSVPRHFDLKGGESMAFAVDVETTSQGRHRCVVDELEPDDHRQPSGHRDGAT